MDNGHLEPGDLVAQFAGPSGEPALPERSLLHAAGCAECRLLLAGLGLAAGPETEHERAALARLGPPQLHLGLPLHEKAKQEGGAFSLQRLFIEVRRRLAARGPFALPAVGFALVPALAVLLVVALKPAAPEDALAPLQGASRPLEPAISGLPYAPYQPQRGARDEAAFDRPLRTLLEAREKSRPGAERALAMLFLLRGGAGDGTRTDKLLAQAGHGADAENDRGVVLHARGDYAGALDAWDRALEEEPLHRPARFNRGLALDRLGLHEAARSWFEKVVVDDPRSPWVGEARARAQRLREWQEPARQRASPRNEALRALYGAQDRGQILAAQERLLALPAGQVLDLLALAKWAAAQPLAWALEHGKRWRRYQELRGQAMGGGLDPAEAQAFAQEADGDRLLQAPSLQLAAFVLQARGQWKLAETLDAQLVQACKKQGCAVENEAIALDELADSASRDGDLAEARKLMLRAEALLIGVDAEPQLAELHRKRASFLLEEKRVEEASQTIALVLREMTSDESPRAVALGLAGDIESVRGHLRSAAELWRGGLELARALGAHDIETDAAASLADDELALGRAGDARATLRAAIVTQEESQHPLGVAVLRLHLARLELEQGDAAGSLLESQRGLEAAASGALNSTRIGLQFAHARALQALGRDGEAGKELLSCVDGAARAAASSENPFAAAVLAGGAREAAAALALSQARAGQAPEELVLPLDKLRAASLRATPAVKGWSQALAEGACVVALLPADRYTLAVLVTRHGGEFHLFAGPPATALQHGLAPLSLAQSCDRELWLLAEAPIDALALSDSPSPSGEPLSQRFAVGFATTITRLLAPEPAPRSGLLVHDVLARGDAAGVAVLLPFAQREEAAVAGFLGRSPLVELSGDSATPAAALASARNAQLLHFAVHGFDPSQEEGGFLQLAQAPPDSGRLTARQVALAPLTSGTRVVLSACNAAATGAHGLGWAFARAGAVAVAAARDRIDDQAAAIWSERFYAALARGAPFVQANSEAARAALAAGSRPSSFVVLK